MRILDLQDPGFRTGDAVVSASAGSGKTFTLTVVVTGELGLEALRPFEILATTFSEAAASDLRERLLRPLDLLASVSLTSWERLLPCLRTQDEAGLKEALQHLPLAPRLEKSRDEVRQAARLWTQAATWMTTPSQAWTFWRRTRREAEMLQVSTLHALALSLLKEADTPEDVLDAEHPALLRLLRQALRTTLTRPEQDPDRGLARRLLGTAESRWREFSMAHDAHIDAMGVLPAPNLEETRSRLREALATARAAFHPLAEQPERAFRPNRNGARNAHASDDKLRPVPPPEAPLDVQVAWVESQADALWDPEKKAPGYWSEAAVAAADTLKPVVHALENHLGGLLVTGLRAFEDLKHRQGYATFGDLVRRALDRLRQNRLTPPRPKLLLVDEYQDTSPVQDAFLEALEAARILRVGDLKQAIYGFRGGEAGLLQNRIQAAGERAYRLPTNHRSAAPIVDLANRFVGDLWPSLDPQAHVAEGLQEPARGGTIPIGFHAQPLEQRKVRLSDQTPWISALAQNAGWEQALDQATPPGPRTRALLLQQRTGLAELLLRLKARGIRPYVLSRDGFWASPGVRWVMGALEAVARPQRALPLVALLRHSLGLTDGELTELAAAGRLKGLATFDPDDLPPRARQLGQSLTRLRSLGTQEIAAHLLAEGGLLASLTALEAHGSLEPLRARRNLASFLSLLEGLSAHPAVAWHQLHQLLEGVAKGDVPGDAAAADLLIPTVHGSKGLEYQDVILPMLWTGSRNASFGQWLTDPTDQTLKLGWRLGGIRGIHFDHLCALQKTRARRDSLNLLYVALTRARERLIILQQGPAPSKRKALEHTGSWGEWAQELHERHPHWKVLGKAPEVPSIPRDAPPPLVLPEPSPSNITAEGPQLLSTGSPAESVRARRDGEAMHAFIRDLLLRWSDPAALQSCLECAPDVPHAQEQALRFLDQLEQRGWHAGTRRRTELPLAGAAATGAEGRADLVIWDAAGMHLIDLKHSEGFGDGDLARYQGQLQRYAQALALRFPRMPLCGAWLVALKSGTWVPVTIPPANPGS